MTAVQPTVERAPSKSARKMTLLWALLPLAFGVPVRRSMRQLIAMTQGILATSRPDSGISDASSTDRFTATDVSAMKRMSGCF